MILYQDFERDKNNIMVCAEDWIIDLFEFYWFELTVQRISPEGSSKIQIQLVLHDGNSLTFQFTSEPQANAKKARDDVKDLLAQLIPAHRKKANKELEEKNR